MGKEILKMMYGIEIETEGLEKAFKKAIKMIEKSKEEVLEANKKEYGEKNAEYIRKLNEIDIKLFYISNGLMCKKVIERKEKLTILINELENIVAELKEVETNNE